MQYRVVEKFVSINGEGEKAGQLAVFIRFAGCNLKCSYCDTMWANSADVRFHLMTAGEIYEYIKSQGIRNVTLTGGEPLIQEGIGELLELLAEDSELRVEIETNGSVDIRKFTGIKPEPPVFTVDCKLEGSGMAGYMLGENYSVLTPRDSVKFVVGSTGDLEAAREIIKKYSLTEICNVHLSPVFGKIDMEEIVEFMKINKMNRVRLSIQLHKIIWHPEKRGV